MDWTIAKSSTQSDRPSLRTLIETGEQVGIPTVAFSQTHWKKMNKRSVRSAKGRYIYSQDAHDFQKENIVEGGLPSRALGTLEGPIEELYKTITCAESLRLCWQGYREEWSANRIGFPDEEKLHIQLAHWHEKTKQRSPIQHDPEDGHTIFRKKGKILSVIEFVPENHSGSISPLSDDMKKQLEQLGYLE